MLSTSCATLASVPACAGFIVSLGSVCHDCTDRKSGRKFGSDRICCAIESACVAHAVLLVAFHEPSTMAPTCIPSARAIALMSPSVVCQPCDQEPMSSCKKENCDPD